MIRPVVALVALVTALSACDLLTGPTAVIELVRIDTVGASPIVPDTVAAGVEFPVTILGWIGACSTFGPIEVERINRSIVITPYSTTEVEPHQVCPGSLHGHIHTTELRWDRVGSFEVLVYAIDEWTGNPMLLRYPVSAR